MIRRCFPSVRAKPEHQLGHVDFLVVEVAALARRQEPLRIADVAGVEILQAGGELVLQRLEATTLLAGLLELAGVDLPHALHRARRTGGAIALANEGLDVAQAEAHLLELADPPDADERLRPVEAKAPLGPGGRGQQSQLLVQVDGPCGLPCFTGQVADLHQLFGGAVEREAKHGEDSHALVLRARESCQERPCRMAVCLPSSEGSPRLHGPPSTADGRRPTAHGP